jgi:2'-hydroxyisoflavone reductase
MPDWHIRAYLLATKKQGFVMAASRRDVLKLSAIAAFVAGTSSAESAEPKLAQPTRRPLNILILGGTGYTGPNQVKYALERGHKITLFNRGRKPQNWPGEVEELVGDRDTGEVKALKGRKWDVCIDNPTSVPFWVRDVGKVLKGNIQHYIFISTLSAYADDKTIGADESAATQVYKGKDIMQESITSLRADMALYGPMKAACEREAKKYFGARTTIIRPGFIVGPEDPYDRLTYWVQRMAQGGPMLVPGDGLDPLQYIDPRDLAEWTVRMAEMQAFGTFNATGPDYPLSADAFFYGLRAVTTAGAQFVRAPAKFVEDNALSPGGDLPVWVPRGTDTDGFATRSNRAAVAKGLSFRPIATTASDTLAWFNAQPEERRKTLRAGLSLEKEAALLAKLR